MYDTAYIKPYIVRYIEGNRVWFVQSFEFDPSRQEQKPAVTPSNDFVAKNFDITLSLLYQLLVLLLLLLPLLVLKLFMLLVSLLFMKQLMMLVSLLLKLLMLLYFNIATLHVLGFSYRYRRSFHKITSLTILSSTALIALIKSNTVNKDHANGLYGAASLKLAYPKNEILTFLLFTAVTHSVLGTREVKVTQ